MLREAKEGGGGGGSKGPTLRVSDDWNWECSSASSPPTYCGGLPAPPSERRRDGSKGIVIWPRPFVGGGGGSGWPCDGVCAGECC